MLRHGEKRTVYMHDDTFSEIQREAERQDRSVSWLVQQAWKIAKDDLAKLPTAQDAIDEAEERIRGGE